ncbi:MAG: hypothetical protein BM555_03680 [Crocinitomix sp. MedPE-SWsnd]|nr:MAG: hypothetical protein BM555_03680 [Crocinitomix sp. MedPE-SWsnd]
MNNKWVKYSLIFILIVLIQGLVVNNIQINEYFNPMVYPIMIMMLPFELNAVITMGVALILGVSVDAFSNTFGLHASSALFIGYLRPTIMKYIRPKEGYDTSLLPSIQDMGTTWFLAYVSVIIFAHHLWFFSIEILRFDLFVLILAKTFMSFIFSIGLIILFQYIFYKPSKK